MAKRILIIVAVLALAVTGYWFLRPQTDVVATVNGQGIPRSELDARVNDIKTQHAMYGMAVTVEMAADITEGVLDELIVEALLIQGAKVAGINITAQEVEEYYALMVSGYDSEEAFLDLLAQTDYTVDSVKLQIADHLAVRQFERRYIDESVPPELLVISELEILELYEDYASHNEDIPPLDEVIYYLEQELLDERIAMLGVLDQMVEGLRAQATIKIKL